MEQTKAKRLATLQSRYRALQAQLTRVGFITKGSLVRRFMPCGKPGCRCQADPPQLHGPYWQWSTAVGGRTLTRRLTEPQARRYQEWIDNRRRMEKTIAKMEDVSRRAAELLLDETSEAMSSRRAKRVQRDKS